MNDELKCEITKLEPDAEYAIVFDEYLTMAEIDEIKSRIIRFTSAKVVILCGARVVLLKKAVIVAEVPALPDGYLEV